MSDPFHIDGPAIISFSGGRTSGYLLRRVLDAHGGTLPLDVIPCFANTGKEMPQTLDFVRDCRERWNVDVVWLEYDPAGPTQRKFRRVCHATASRDGEPFAALIRRKSYLPNPVTRFCTIELKIRVVRDFALSLGWTHWTNVLGLRYDEPRRVANVKDNRDRWENSAPLYDARITKQDVAAFWAGQSFDLALPNVNGKTPLGNCDLCFLKAANVVSSIIRDDPGRASWWADMESEIGATFRKDRPGYAAMADAVARQQQMDFGDRDELADCFCHD